MGAQLLHTDGLIKQPLFEILLTRYKPYKSSHKTCVLYMSYVSCNMQPLFPPHSMNKLVYILNTCCVYCAIRTEIMGIQY